MALNEVQEELQHGPADYSDGAGPVRRLHAEAVTGGVEHRAPRRHLDRDHAAPRCDRRRGAGHRPRHRHRRLARHDRARLADRRLAGDLRASDGGRRPGAVHADLAGEVPMLLSRGSGGLGEVCPVHGVVGLAGAEHGEDDVAAAPWGSRGSPTSCTPPPSSSGHRPASVRPSSAPAGRTSTCCPASCRACLRPADAGRLGAPPGLLPLPLPLRVRRSEGNARTTRTAGSTSNCDPPCTQEWCRRGDLNPHALNGH